ncbi:MAG TPA: hypothetical protein VHZ02_00395, partial [Acidimicrobiales bacterium]|nr:hypothetical protein [Acidimicrobiales bacterium]
MLQLVGLMTIALVVALSIGISVKLGAAATGALAAGIVALGAIPFIVRDRRRRRKRVASPPNRQQLRTIVLWNVYGWTMVALGIIALVTQWNGRVPAWDARLVAIGFWGMI